MHEACADPWCGAPEVHFGDSPALPRPQDRGTVAMWCVLALAVVCLALLPPHLSCHQPPIVMPPCVLQTPAWTYRTSFTSEVTKTAKIKVFADTTDVTDVLVRAAERCQDAAEL